MMGLSLALRSFFTLFFHPHTLCDENGEPYKITADFRKYENVGDSIGDHSAYLLGAMNGSVKRYAGLSGEKDYKKSVQIIKDGGYPTNIFYVAKICSIIERWGLKKYDVAGAGGTDEKKYYRVRRKWSDAASQVGAFLNLEYAKNCADEHSGYVVFAWNGNAVYGSSGVANTGCPFLLRVGITNLNIRKGPGTNTAKTGRNTGIATFAILEVRSGKGLMPDGED